MELGYSIGTGFDDCSQLDTDRRRPMALVQEAICAHTRFQILIYLFLLHECLNVFIDPIKLFS